MEISASFTRSSRLQYKLLSLVLVLAFLFTALPQPARAATCARTYTVKSGDTLSKIAFDYGVTVQAIAAENNLKDPYTIFVGQSLCLPSSASSSTSGSTSSSTTGSTSTSKKNSISVVDYSNRIILELTNFPKKTVYYVKMNDDGRRNYKWYRLGTLKTSSSGAANANFKVPDKMRNKSVIVVCLKNALSDAVTCTRFNNQLPISGR